MKPYIHFANIYDHLMAHVEYEHWITYMKTVFEERNVRVSKVLDVGCGTGELMLRMNQAGFVPTGLDISEDMLAVAQRKLQSAQTQPQLFQEDMSQFSVLERYDAITIFCDSLNYLEKEEDVKRVFLRCYDALQENGILLFDVHSPFKIQQFYQATFADELDGVSYIWHSFAGEEPLSVEHELTFFIETENGLYERVEELHKERTFDIATYTKWLMEAGFTDIRVTGDFHQSEPHDQTERIFFSARKKAGN
ncbi:MULTISPECIES: class I SAM-dependent DNA methyltransferase [Shouchella]|uniref:Class I SAM-dependent methyltransferase n=1 Tax=Shouchella hunanensis TaxID=766894 RepID=A0ABY7W237_9BACI|nr:MULTISPECIES: class I SAM-dependent methyltransferase [Shouchella]WDF03002.1 class I SAM-dependent methyltransferase [Shouchella hunanensis]GAF22983.1 LOW QUALITY PROTEIN: methyltransferase [Bacillus sp. JCM 19047]